MSDSAFFQLNRIANVASYADYDKIASEPDFDNIHHDQRWYPLLLVIKSNQEKVTLKEKNYDRVLIKKIDSLASEDQKWRSRISAALSGTATIDTALVKAMSIKMLNTDSLNFPIVQNIINEFGFPNFNLVGENGSRNFWLLVQHQDQHPDFQELVLSMMKKEVYNKLASPTDYAYLIDRVKVNTGQLQIYGTQMQLNKDHTLYEPKPVIDPININLRRKEMNLPPIEEYIQIMNNSSSALLKK